MALQRKEGAFIPQGSKPDFRNKSQDTKYQMPKDKKKMRRKMARKSRKVNR
mgnify:CR=1 FL=1